MWWKQQAEEKERKNNQIKNEKDFFDQQTLQITEYRNQLEEEKAHRLRNMEIAYKQTNLQQLDEKINREANNRSLEQQEKANHIDFLTSHDFFT